MEHFTVDNYTAAMREYDNFLGQEAAQEKIARDSMGENNERPEKGTDKAQKFDDATVLLNTTIRPKLASLENRIAMLRQNLPELQPKFEPEVQNAFNALNIFNGEGDDKGNPEGLKNDDMRQFYAPPSSLPDNAVPGQAGIRLDLGVLANALVSTGDGSTDGSGANTVQTTVIPTLWQKMKHFGGILDTANCYYAEGGPHRHIRWDMTARKAKRRATTAMTDEAADIANANVKAFGYAELDGIELVDRTDVSRRMFRRSEMPNVGQVIMQALATGTFRMINSTLTNELAKVSSKVRIEAYGLKHIVKQSVENVKIDYSDFGLEKLIQIMVGELDAAYSLLGNASWPYLDVGYGGKMLEMIGSPWMGPSFQCHQQVLAKILGLNVGSDDKRLVLDPEMVTLPTGLRCYAFRGWPFIINNDLDTPKTTDSTINSATDNDANRTLYAKSLTQLTAGDHLHHIVRFSAPVTYYDFFDSATFASGNERMYGVHTEVDANYGARESSSADKCDALFKLTGERIADA